MNHRVGHSLVISTAAVVAICTAFGVHAADMPAADQPGGAARVSGPEGQAQPAGRAGGAMRVYIDPNTGKPVAPPVGGGAESDQIRARESVPLPDEVPNPGPAGGFMLNTKGHRFEFEATTGTDGKTTVECRPQAVKPAVKE